MAVLLEIGILLVCFLQVTRSKIVLVLLLLLIRVGVQLIINYAIGLQRIRVPDRWVDYYFRDCDLI